MNVIGKRIESQVHFWSLLGPFLVLLSASVLIFKVSPHWYFPLSALVGIPLCVKWKMKGLAGALACLFAFATFSYSSLDLNERYWHVGLSLAVAFSFIVFTLSLEEVQALIGKLELESNSRLDNFLILDERLKTAEQEWSFEREKLQVEVKALALEAAKVLEEKQTFYKLAGLAKEELIQIRNAHEQLIEEYAYKKHLISQLKERLEENEITIQSFVDSDAEKRIEALTHQIELLEREKNLSTAKFHTMQNENESLQNFIQESNIEKANLLNRNSELQKIENALQMTLSKKDQQLIQLEKEKDIKEQDLLELEKVKTNLLNALQFSESEKNRLAFKEKELKDSISQIEEFNRQIENKRMKELNELQSRFQLVIDEFETTNQALEAKQEEIKKLQNLLEQFKREKEEKPLEAQASTSVNEGKAMALYLQLREQFEEKNAILHATRQELFRANEMLLSIKKEQDEMQMSEPSDEECRLVQCMADLSKEYEQMQIDAQHEIKVLSEIISHLFHSKSVS